MGQKISGSNIFEDKRPSLKKHRNQALWQIYIPLTVGCLIVLVLIGLIIITSSNAYHVSSGLADLSLIALIFLAGFIGLILMILLFAIVFGVAKLLQITPVYTRYAQSYVFRAAIKLYQLADHSVKPIIKVQSIIYGAKALFSKKSRK